MKLFAALLIIILIAFSGYHLSFRSFRLPLFARTFYMTGVEYLFLGLLLGPQFLNLIDQETLTGLAPLSALLLGWVGLLCGFQFEFAGIGKFPRSFFLSSVIEAAVSFLVVFSALYVCLPFWFQLSGPHLLTAATGLSAAATCSSQTGLALLTSEILKKRSRFVNYLRYVASINGIMGLILFSFVFLFNSGSNTRDGLFFKPTTFSILSVLVANLTLIVLYNLFLAKRKEKKELALLLTGMVIMTSGAASLLSFSPLLANFALGVFLVNTRREKDRIFSLLIWAEKPLYLLLLVFLGASWTPGGLYQILLAAGYILIRLGGKLVSGLTASVVYRGRGFTPPYLGMGLLEQGGVPLAIYFDMMQSFPGTFMSHLVGVAIIALIINDMASPRMLVTMFQFNGFEPKDAVEGQSGL